ncbi:S-adenosyl-L-methionine-dependent methyltransferase [Ilyonectria destructans]|nr:S-adenosyl-L-methionine-dependent methyltransferase [Ilyonectria destructans]
MARTKEQQPPVQPETTTPAKQQTTSAPPPAEQAPIQFDPRVVGDLDDDNDSAADAESLRDSTASITSSILEYRNINGRKYQSSKTTEYWAPTDEKHIQGLDVSHQFTLMLMRDKLFLSPLAKSPQKILDVGTGTGIWAIDVADEYPSADVLGFDISAVQPSWIPPNCSFQIDDAQLDWTFKEGEFDFIHMRYLYGGIDDWSKLYRQAFRHVKPGAWVENTEIDLETRSENPKVSGDEGHIFKKWRNLFWEAGAKINRTFKIARDNQMEQKMREAGFVDIQHHQWKVPIGGWPRDPKFKQIGLYNGMFIDQSLDGFAVFPIGEILGWTFDEVTVLVNKMRLAIKDPKALPYYNVHTVIGRRPETVPAASD